MREDWQRLASWVISTRDRLGMATQGELSQQSGASLRQVGEIENGRRVGARTLARIERALNWEPGSAQAVLRGGKPTSSEEAAEPEDLRDDIERQIWAISELEEDLRWSYIYMRRAKIDAEQQRGQGRTGHAS